MSEQTAPRTAAGDSTDRPVDRTGGGTGRGSGGTGRGSGGGDVGGPGTVGPEPSTARGEQTRQLILETALRLFRERGYAQTTMRAIAREAGVAVGNAYYYFESKEHLIQGFYRRTHADHVVAAAPALAAETDFAARLRAVLHAGIDVLTPSHAFAATFFKTAAEPTSPLSPFSAQSSEARTEAIRLFEEVLAGSTAKVDPQLRPDLPELLWLGYLGVILYWVHDRSPDQSKTRLLIDGAVPLVDRLVGLSRLRVLRPVTTQVLELIRSLRH
ncbi:TetR/AcrR family transcriptional regulator [Plantactinospora endophytica]|uniref:TetR family transcriptional regulator n=1 Tax=Plantactinospora endophytica TaxID=673535 RepID=A0ABQ4DV31_9ACTN|nr:TetR family transcriptional regulator [Plantactinospora endophytica]GIG86319.1 TetR family transcriptional regulator [Plantactinospora endophytica]